MKIPEILSSKKGQAFLAGLVALVCQHLLGLDEATTTKITGLVSAYLLGQGIADVGKEAEKAKQAPQP